MIKSFLLLLLFFNASIAIAQKSTSWNNHTLLDVKNLESSVDFYTIVFQLDTIPYPFSPSPEYILKLRLKTLMETKYTLLKQYLQTIARTAKYDSINS